MRREKKACEMFLRGALMLIMSVKYLRLHQQRLLSSNYNIKGSSRSRKKSCCFLFCYSIQKKVKMMKNASPVFSISGSSGLHVDGWVNRKMCGLELHWAAFAYLSCLLYGKGKLMSLLQIHLFSDEMLDPSGGCMGEKNWEVQICLNVDVLFYNFRLTIVFFLSRNRHVPIIGTNAAERARR